MHFDDYFCKGNVNWDRTASSITDNLVANPLKFKVDKGNKTLVPYAAAVASSIVPTNIACSSSSAVLTMSTVESLDSVSSPTDSSETISMDLHKLTGLDKQRINAMHDKIDKSKL